MPTARALARKFRKVRSSIAKQIRTHPGRIGLIEFGNLVAERCPGRQHFVGGELFEFWFNECGKQSSVAKARTTILPNGQWSAEARQYILRMDYPRWAFGELVKMYSLSQKNTPQLFFYTLILEWKGLTKSGMDLGHGFNICLHPKNYRQQKIQLVMEEKDESARVILRHQPLLWFDNYSKIFNNPFYNMVAGAYRDACYTAFAMLYAPRAAMVSMAIRVDGNARVVVSNRTTILDLEAIAVVARSFEVFDDYASIRYYNTAVSNQAEYTNLISTPAFEYAEDADFQDSPNGLANMRTWGMVNHDVGTNEGLVQVLLHLREITHHANHRYHSLLCDPGIFWRVQRV